MQLTHIAIDKLSISTANMRHGKRPPDVSDILPSVRARGVLMPLLVRANGTPDTFEIVAGRRRYFAARAVADERGESEPLPCAIMEAGDDAGALEASLIENIARLDPDEMTQYETFARLIKDGKTIDDIAAVFGLTDRTVKQRLALGNLLRKIRDLYRGEKIDIETIRHLTLASKSQQKDWLMLFEDPENRAPSGFQVKQWLFGGQSIATSVALFPLEDGGQIVADLFGEDSYFVDADLFWQKQNEAIAAKREALLGAGWTEVTVLEQGQHFNSWDHEKTPKKKGGTVFITVSNRGEVECHEGWLTRKEARKGDNKTSETDEGKKKTARPEVTGALQTYIDLHRHAVVRNELLDHPGVALRLMVAHAIGGSRLWEVKPEPQRAGRASTEASVRTSAAETAFAARRAEVLSLLGFPEGTALVAGQVENMAATFARLLTLPDAEVLRILTAVMAETLEAGSALVEAAGVHLKVDMRKNWQADDAFFDLVRDKGVVTAMVGDIAGKTVADGNIAATGKVQKQIVRDCLNGTNGRTKIEGWTPRWMQFPIQVYRENSGQATAEKWAEISHLFPVQ
jgi:ParB family chromosome partitioning protein